MRIRFNNMLPLAALALLASGCASTQPVPEAKPEPKVTEAKPAPTPPPVAAQPAPSTTMSYNVVRGDHLWGISSKGTIYGNPYQWPLIYKANRDKIQDADLIEPGWVLSIDKNPSPTDIDAAVLHAKTRGTWQLGVSEKSDLNFLNGAPTRVGSK